MVAKFLSNMNLDFIRSENLGQLRSIARLTKREHVLKREFPKSKDLWKFLKRLSKNQDAKNIHLDVSENPFDSNCAEEISKLLERGILKYLFLPAGMEEDDVEKIFSSLNKSSLETLDISGNYLSENSLDLLEKIMRKRKLRNSLFLRGCTCPVRSIKKTEKLLYEMERSKIIVEPCNVQLSWDITCEQRDEISEEESLPSCSLDTETKPSSKSESVDSGIGASARSLSNFVLGLPKPALESRFAGLLSREWNKKFPSSVSLPPERNPRTRLCSKEEFESTQSLIGGSPKPRRLLSPRPSPEFEKQCMAEFTAPLHTEEELAGAAEINSPPVLACSFSSDIGPTGGKIDSPDCCVTFPKESFQCVTKVTGKLEIDPSRVPVDYVPVAPFLKLESERRSLKPVKIKMMSWCIYEVTNNDLHLDVLHFSDDWETWDVMLSIPFKNDMEYEFETPTYSGFLIALKRRLTGPETYLIEGGLFADNDANFTLLFHLKSSFLAQLFSQNKALECQGERRVHFNILKAKLDDFIEALISAENVDFAHGGRLSFMVDDHFITTQSWRKLQTCVLENNPVKRPLVISCCVQQNSQVLQDDCTFRYTERKGEKTVYIDKKHVTANTVAMDKAQVTLPSRHGRFIELFWTQLCILALLFLWHQYFGH